MTQNAATAYLDIFHPEILQKMQEQLSGIDCSPEAVRNIISQVQETENWKKRLIIIASSLVLFSPETILIGCTTRYPVTKIVSQELGVSRPAISKNISQATYYYQRFDWCRNAVDKIVKEVRG